ncbi:hypothetical protein WUBG_01831 [Wuchereria bancrofti]|uniref:Uncharacterized protein n=1 Tax=Wuchereria bancrofti TaxID=6293 RepID=J9EXC4_WUCBA|nr:hypothetical protein WUBG_01831 [Wuchereria bancrofti]
MFNGRHYFVHTRNLHVQRREHCGVGVVCGCAVLAIFLEAGHKDVFLSTRQHVMMCRVHIACITCVLVIVRLQVVTECLVLFVVASWRSVR